MRNPAIGNAGLSGLHGGNRTFELLRYDSKGNNEETLAMLRSAIDSRVGFVLHVLGPKTSEAFQMACAPEKFDALKAAFDSIIASYRMTK